MEDAEDWDTESTYSLLLNPADWEEEDPWLAMDGGDVDDEEEDINRKCPGCQKIFGGKTEKGRRKWLAEHIRLHNIADRRRKLLTEDELKTEFPKLLNNVLTELTQKDHWRETKEIASLLLERDTSQLSSFLADHLVPILGKSTTGFLRDDQQASTKGVHSLLSSQCFREEAISQLQDCLGESLPFSRFLSSLTMRLKDSLTLLRISKLKERLPTPVKQHHDKERKELVFYIVGYILMKIKDKCWYNGNIKKERYSKRFRIVKEYFMQGGTHAEDMEEREVRQWVDKKNRGDANKNGLVIPSKAAFLFFLRLDTIARAFEGVQDLTQALTAEAMYSRCMDDIQLLDLWNNLTDELSDIEQHCFLDSTINHYRRFVGHATSKRIERCLPGKATVATRTNIKKNPEKKKKNK